MTAGSAIGSSALDDGPDLVPGVDLVTEEVEPGVSRVVNDGIRDLSHTLTCSSDLSEDTRFRSAIAAGLDGSIWMSTPDRSYRVGQARTWDGDAAVLGTPVAVSADGTVWTSWTHDGVRRLSDDEWVAVEEFDGMRVAGIDVTSDDALWAQVLSVSHDTTRISRLDTDGLTTTDVPNRFGLPLLGVNPGSPSM